MQDMRKPDVLEDSESFVRETSSWQLRELGHYGERQWNRGFVAGVISTTIAAILMQLLIS